MPAPGLCRTCCGEEQTGSAMEWDAFPCSPSLLFPEAGKPLWTGKSLAADSDIPSLALLHICLKSL